jgi:uncharacterized membrane protein
MSYRPFERLYELVRPAAPWSEVAHMSDLLFSFAAGFLTCFILIVVVALFVIRAYRPPSRQIGAVAGDQDRWQSR